VTFLEKHEVTFYDLNQKVIPDPGFAQILKILETYTFGYRNFAVDFIYEVIESSAAGLSVLRTC